MKIPKNIFEKQGIKEILIKRNLLDQYKKSVKYILSGNTTAPKFKLRKPKKDGIYYFRINKQYRAIGVFDDENNFLAFAIDNHQ